MMRAEGFDPERVSTLFAPPTGRGIDLLKKGEVDAYAGFYYSELWRARGAGVAIAQIRPANYGVDFYGPGCGSGTRLSSSVSGRRAFRAGTMRWNIPRKSPIASPPNCRARSRSASGRNSSASLPPMSRD